jgi:hypothetical protein
MFFTPKKQCSKRANQGSEQLANVTNPSPKSTNPIPVFEVQKQGRHH